jgi:hypothetical protein
MVRLANVDGAAEPCTSFLKNDTYFFEFAGIGEGIYRLVPGEIDANNFIGLLSPEIGRASCRERV